MIESVSGADCIVFVNSPDGQQQLELAVRESVTVADITRLVRASAVSVVSLLANAN